MKGTCATRDLVFSQATGPIAALSVCLKHPSLFGEADDLLEGQKHNSHFLSHVF